MKINKYAYAAGVAASLMLFAACGDDVTEVTNVSEKASLDQVEKYKKLPKCEDENEGSLVYVKDSAKVYACTGDGWVQLNGKDGSDGKNGKDGKDGKSGEDGTGCTAKQNKDETGFDIVCDGKTVGTLKNGEDGADGKKGDKGAKGDAGADGEDGTSCTAKQNKDKTGFDIICDGETKGTITNGTDGEAGDGCSLKDDGNGVLTVTCGKKSVNIIRAMCVYYSDRKAVPYDPETQLCFSKSMTIDGERVYENFALPRCADQSVRGLGYEGDASNYTYDPTNYRCEKGVLVEECKLTDKDGNDSLVANFDAKTMWCNHNENTVVVKVPCSEGNKDFYALPGQYCYRKAGDALTTMRYADSLTCGSKKYNPVTHFCYSKDGSKIKKMDICAKNKTAADPFNIDIRYTDTVSVDNNESYLCDSRDYQVYKTKIMDDGETTWMVENLRYAYKNPTYGYDANPKAGLDSSSFCYNDDCSKGRVYLWSAVVDSAALASLEPPVYCGYGADADKCNAKLAQGPVQGVCPEGWHVPTVDEAKTYPSAYFKADGWYLTNQNKWSTNSFERILTVMDVDDGIAKTVYFERVSGPAKETDLDKRTAFPVHCIKNSAVAAPAAGE